MPQYHKQFQWHLSHPIYISTLIAPAVLSSINTLIVQPFYRLIYFSCPVASVSPLKTSLEVHIHVTTPPIS